MRKMLTTKRPNASSELVETSSKRELSNILAEISQLGLYTKDPSAVAKATLDRKNELEGLGYKFDNALASIHLLILEQMGSDISPFEVTSWETSTVRSQGTIAKVKATLKGTVGQGSKVRNFETSSEGVGPIHAIDLALRNALCEEFPEIRDVKLISYSLDIVDSSNGSAAPARARTEFRDTLEPSKKLTWATVSVSDDVIDASIRSLIDGYRYKLIFLNKKERFAIPDWRAAIA
jgi:2-isopropylmalate synthase